jgi:hypothetical protein
MKSVEPQALLVTVFFHRQDVGAQRHLTFVPSLLLGEVKNRRGVVAVGIEPPASLFLAG